MPSLIPGYEYDIFISYRQKDNKYDGWVTEFVDNLKKELEATFKEDVSVYFDINPHDGLLETHEVSDSLREKLKCAVFIPIVSRTYCDPKSFAWENEFKAFVESASNDKFGLKVKLPNGNIASRVLPVRIHDLDNSDIKLCESVLGGVMRGVEFIYKSAGVNRPLRLKEENPQENLNHTIYRDQINKVANAVREIISGLLSAESSEEPDFSEEESGQREIEEEEAVIRLKKKRIGIIVGFILILFVCALFVFQLLGKKSSSDKRLEKSIAVLPFHNFSEDPNQEVRSDALTNEIINHLYKIKSFDRVVPFTSVMIYKKPDKSFPQIADELKVNYILEGSYQKIGDSLRITTHLIEPGKDKYIWQNDYNKPYKEIISIQSDIALQIAANVNAFITVSEKQNIQKIPTSNMEAYDLVQKAMVSATRGQISIYQALDSTLKAISLDPNYADAYATAGILSIYTAVSPVSLNDMQSAIKNAFPFIEKALKLDQNNSLAHFAMGNIYEWGRWDYIEAEKEYLKVKELAPNMATSGVNDLIGEFFLKMNRPESAILYFNKVLNTGELMSGELYLEYLTVSGKDQEAYNYKNNNLTVLKRTPVYLGTALIWLNDYDSARFYLESALKSGDPQMKIPRYLSDLAFAYFKTNRIDKANEIIDQLITRSHISLAGSPEYYIGRYYSGIGEIDSAFVWLEKAFKNKSPEMPWLKMNPFFKSLKSDKRYWDLYERCGFKAYDDYIAGLKK
jgi:TolB-like protein/TPR repeat protein